MPVATFLASESLSVLVYILYVFAFSEAFHVTVIELSSPVALTKSGLSGAFSGCGVADTTLDLFPSQSPEVALTEK